MFRHVRAVNKLQLGLYRSNGTLKATGDMYTTHDKEAKHTVMGLMRMELAIQTCCKAIPCA